MTLEQLGAPSYKKLLSCLGRGVVYRKDGTLCVAIMRGDGEPLGAALLPPMTENERILMRASPDFSN
jgi:hypothetical protein